MEIDVKSYATIESINAILSNVFFSFGEKFALQRFKPKSVLVNVFKHPKENRSKYSQQQYLIKRLQEFSFPTHNTLHVPCACEHLQTAAKEFSN